MSRDCDHHGHIWLTADDQPYQRQRGNNLTATVDVYCRHCPGTRELPKYSTFSGTRALGQPIDQRIPPQFKAVLDRALIEAQQKNDGPVQKP